MTRPMWWYLYISDICVRCDGTGYLWYMWYLYEVWWHLDICDICARCDGIWISVISLWCVMVSVISKKVDDQTSVMASVCTCPQDWKQHGKGGHWVWGLFRKWGKWPEQEHRMTQVLMTLFLFLHAILTNQEERFGQPLHCKILCSNYPIVQSSQHLCFKFPNSKCNQCNYV